MLEQLARDVTGWDARAVEFFQLLATTQYMNHLRLGQPRRAVAARRRGARRVRDGVRRRSRARSTCAASPAGAAATTSRTSASSCGGSAHYRLARSPATPSADRAGRAPLPLQPARRRRAALHAPRGRGGDHPPGRADQRPGADRPPHAGSRARRLLRPGAQPRRSTSTARRRLSRSPESPSATCATTAPAGRTTRRPAGSPSTPSSAGSSWRSDLAAPAALDVTYHYGAAGDTRRRRATRARPASSRRAAPCSACPRDARDRSRPRSTRSAAPASSRSPTTAATARRSPSNVAADRAIELRAAPGRRPTLELTGPLTVQRRRRAAPSCSTACSWPATPSSCPPRTSSRGCASRMPRSSPAARLSPDGAPTVPVEPSIRVRRAGTRARARAGDHRPAPRSRRSDRRVRRQHRRRLRHRPARLRLDRGPDAAGRRA